jgi:hypothetical protein
MKASEAAAALGRIGGKSTSPAKQAASRANGRLGGRRKSADCTTSNSLNEKSGPLLFVPRKDAE